MSATIDLDGQTVTRSQLYALVWRHEAQAIAKHCQLSGSLLGRICRRWLIPKPGRGDWQQVEAGQTIKKPPLPAWPGSDADPTVLVRSSNGYSSKVPPKVRAARPKKPDRLQETLDEYKRNSDRKARVEQDRMDALAEQNAGPCTRHILTIENWRLQHTINMALRPELGFDDLTTIELDCRYVLPDTRRGEDLRLDILFRLERIEAGGGLMDDVIGRINFRKRRAMISLAQDKATLICTTLAAGNMRAVDLEIVPDGKQEMIRWAGLLSRPYEGVDL